MFIISTSLLTCCCCSVLLLEPKWIKTDTQGYFIYVMALWIDGLGDVHLDCFDVGNKFHCSWLRSFMHLLGLTDLWLERFALSRYDYLLPRNWSHGDGPWVPKEGVETCKVLVQGCSCFCLLARTSCNPSPGFRTEKIIHQFLMNFKSRWEFVAVFLFLKIYHTDT